MRLYLINPSNPLVSIVRVKENRWNRYRVWKPLSLMVLAGLTPPEWEITIVDENLGVPDYPAMPRPDLVGITAFTSQANRAYEVAAHFRHPYEFIARLRCARQIACSAKMADSGSGSRFTARSTQ